MSTLISFDGTERSESEVHRPTNREELRALVDAHDQLAIRGSGLSYCLASASPTSPSVSMRGLNRILDFDAEANTIRVETGLTIGALVRHLVSLDRWFPVLPGHPEITVGGCVAFNTHGKTQHDIGQMVDYVESFTLMHRDHGEIVCSPHENTKLFLLTVGGMGLTGWIVDVTLRVQPLQSGAVSRTAHQALDLVDAVEIMESRSGDESHLYSWNDGNRRGKHFGRGVVYEEQFVDSPASSGQRYRVLRPESRGRLLPFSGWTRRTTSLVNGAYFALESRRPSRTMGVLDAAFPINGKEGYFHAFGRPGFREYQIIIPRDRWSEAVEEVRSLIASTKATIPLTSLKLFRGDRQHMWFTGDGVCLTLDGPANARTLALFAGLDQLAATMGGAVNLAKDSRITAATSARVFPGYEGFKAELATHDPHRRIDSALRRRINV